MRNINTIYILQYLYIYVIYIIYIYIYICIYGVGAVLDLIQFDDAVQVVDSVQFDDSVQVPKTQRGGISRASSWLPQ